MTVLSSFLLAFSLLFGVIDVVIPVHEKDLKTVDLVIESLRNHLQDIGDVYVVSKEKYTENAIWIDETLYPFTLDEVGEEIGGQGKFATSNYRGWFFQQLLKFYAPYVIENLSEDFLVFDSDTRMCQDFSFYDEGKKVFHIVEGTNFWTYHEHMTKMFSELIDFVEGVNPVNHHMLFSKAIIEEMFEQFEEPFWLAFLNRVSNRWRADQIGFRRSASEYTIYFNYCMFFHPDEYKIKVIKVLNRYSYILMPYFGDAHLICNHIRH